MSVKKSLSKTCVTSYRIGVDEKKAIVKEHGTFSEFLNKCVANEIKRLGKDKLTKRYPEKKKVKND